MEKIEDVKLNAIKKFDYIIKVLDSCETYEQTYNVQKWGSKIILNNFLYNKYYTFKRKELISFQSEYLKLFLEKLKVKRRLLNGDI